MNNPTHEELFGTTVNPYPNWCILPAGHGYESYDAGAEYRSHEHEIGRIERHGTSAFYVRSRPRRARLSAIKAHR